MATENLTLPTTPTTLEPREYLRFLEMIESGLPEGTRAYIVSLDFHGKRSLQPVGAGFDIIDMGKPDDIVQHLSGHSKKSKTLETLFEFSRQRLGRPDTGSAAESLHGHTSEIYDVLALLDALASIGGDDEEVSADTVTRVALLAHRNLLDITNRLCEVHEELTAHEEPTHA